MRTWSLVAVGLIALLMVVGAFSGIAMATTSNPTPSPTVAYLLTYGGTYENWTFVGPLGASSVTSYVTSLMLGGDCSGTLVNTTTLSYAQNSTGVFYYDNVTGLTADTLYSFTVYDINTTSGDSSADGGCGNGYTVSASTAEPQMVYSAAIYTDAVQWGWNISTAPTNFTFTLYDGAECRGTAVYTVALAGDRIDEDYIGLLAGFVYSAEVQKGVPGALLGVVSNCMPGFIPVYNNGGGNGGIVLTTYDYYYIVGGVGAVLVIGLAAYYYHKQHGRLGRRR